MVQSRNAITVSLVQSVGTMALGCSDDRPPTNPTQEPVLGVIVETGDTARITIPDTAVANQPFTVTLSTYGGGCTSKGDTEVEIDGLNATVTP